MARLYFSSALLRASPPWLQRLVGARVMQGLVDEIDALTDRLVEGVKLRFPGVVSDETLALLGRERRIRRGPSEDSTTYARRLRTWWDAHRGRGGPYALLAQLRAFFVDWLSMQMDVVYHSGTRRWMDAAGAITRDAVTWGADGTALWAQVWVFLHVPSTIPRSSAERVTAGGGVERVTAGGGATRIVIDSIAPDDLTAEDEATFEIIAREWSAAHVLRTHVVLLWNDRRLWNYPQPVPTWAEWGATSTWGEPPVVLEIEG